MPFDGGNGYRVASEAWARAWRPRRPLSVAEWAARFRRLSSKGAAEPGPWSNDRIPFLRGIMDALDDSHPAREVVFIKSAQVGGSECGLNWIGYTIHQSPVPMLALFPTEKLGEKWARQRLHTMLAETAELRRLVPLGRKADSGNTLHEKSFPDGVLYIGSANVASDVSSIPVARLLLDEVDRFPLELDDEGDPVDLAKRRGATFPRFKSFEISTPTIESLSRINKSWKESTQHRYYVPCPHCEHMQVLRWDGLRWPEGKPYEALFHCEECGAGIAEHNKTEMLARGEWRATYPEREVFGFHVNCLYTPIGLGDTWGQNARAYERAKRDPAKLKVFTNTRLGETNADPEEKLEWEALFERREPIKLRTIPAGYLVITAGVDIQKDRIEVQLVAWGPDERAVAVDYNVIPGDTTRPEVFAKLDAFLQLPITNSRGIEMRITAGAIDAGYLQDDVVWFVLQHKGKGRNLIAVKGSGTPARQAIGLPTRVDVTYRGQKNKRGGELYVLGDVAIKRALFERVRADAATLPADRHVRFSDELGEEYFRQFTAEVFDPNRGTFHKTYDRNEALDTFVYSVAAAMHPSCGVHRMREKDWQRLRDLYEPAQQPTTAPPAAAKLGADPIATLAGFLPTRANVSKG